MFALISDIHGNYPALCAVIAEIEAAGCPRIISLGDVAGYYSQINECIDLLREKQVINIMGNHDDYLVRQTGCPRSNSANSCLAYQNEVITPDNRQWLSQSVSRLDEFDCSMVHGGWNDPLDEYLYELSEDYFRPYPGKYFFSGHTHVQVKAVFGDKTYCNPGSVGQPRDGDSRAAFAIFNAGEITLHRIAYNAEDAANAMQQAGFDEYYWSNLFQGTQIGGKISKTHIIKA